jgi:predicted transcriptional regulator
MVDLKVRRPIYQCCCSACQNYPKGGVAADHQAINRVLAQLDERQRRLFAGLLAMRRGHGGIVAVSEITGLSRTTIRRGIAELQHGVGLTTRRLRKPGGGRKLVEKKCLNW